MMNKTYHGILTLLFPAGKLKTRTALKLVLPIWAVIPACLFFSCTGKKQTGSNSNGLLTSTDTKTYGVITLKPGNAVLYSDFPATIQGQQNVEIRPKIDGYMQSLFVDEGSVVKKGQLLFRISAPLYEQGVRTAEANVKIALADLNAAQMQVNKIQPLVDKNIVSAFELESAKFTLQSKKASLAQAQAALTNARTNLSYASIYSPADGVIGLIPFKMGSLVSSTTTQPLTTVSNIRNIYAYFSINEKSEIDFFTHAIGRTLNEKLATFPPVTMLLPNGMPFAHKGRIESIGGLVNMGTGSVSLRATFPNPERIIRSGGSATIQIPETRDSILLVPQSATYQIQGKIFVYVMGPDSTVHSNAIKVNSNTTAHSYVVEQGLKAGETIVVQGIGNLREGTLIKPRFMNADTIDAGL